MRSRIAALTYLCVAASHVCAQPAAQPADLEKLIREGAVDVLQSRFGDGRNADETHWIAQAARSKAARTKDASARQLAFEAAEKRYRFWLSALERSTAGDASRRIVEQALARMELAEMITTQWASADLDDVEVSSGKRGDRKRLAGLMQAARVEQERARDMIAPLVAELTKREEEFLALGIHDALQTLRFNTEFQIGWSCYFGAIAEEPGDKRNLSLRSAEQAFQRLLGTNPTGTALLQSHLGVALAFREQRRFDEAERHFRQALPEEGEPVLAAQVRYEWARAQIADGKFNDARVTLRPLVDKDVAKLVPAEKSATFYINLAKLWDANSYLVEAETIRRDAPASTAKAAILQQAQNARATGIARMNRLTEQGGPWPAIVQLYVSASVDSNADPRTLGPTELLFVAQQLSAARRPREAIERLREAAGRSGVDPKLMGQILFELGTCQFKVDDTRAAAETFAKLASELKNDPKAPEAATSAYQLWAKLAMQSKQKQDYEKLASVLLNLIQSYPDHEQRVEATWWLPLAKQEAGQFAEAAVHYAQVSHESPHWEEAQFRAVLCERLAMEASRSAIAPDEYVRRATQIAGRFVNYAKQAVGREAFAGSSDEIRKWAAEAIVHAGEIHLLPGIEQYAKAIEALSGFEERFAGSDAIGRMLAARIRAYCGLRQLDQAGEAVQKYLATVPADKAGPVLTLVAQGFLDELDRLRKEDRVDDARRLAAEAIPIFQELERWCSADPKRARSVEFVSFSLARMQHVAGQLEPAEAIVKSLLAKDPSNGNYQRLRALILTAKLRDDDAGAAVEDAKQAWLAFLTDSTVRTRAPERYWEARYYYLRLALRQGRATEVEKAIRQERVWFPDLGGMPWSDKLEKLYRQAAEQAGVKIDDAAASRPAKGP